MIRIRSASSRRGFTLIELAIVLAIAGVLFVGLWRLLAGGNQQIKDSTAATQQEQLITAVKAFLATQDGQTYMTTDAGGTQRGTNPFLLALPTTPAGSNCASVTIAGLTSSQATVWCNLLPPGFSDKSINAYGQTFAIGIKRDGGDAAKAPSTYSFMIVTVGGDTIPDSSGGRISSQIGSDGGFRYTNVVCGGDAAFACGAFGAWMENPSAYNLNTTGGHVASRTFSSPEDNSGLPWLARIAMKGDADFHFNTMVTDLFMGQKTKAANINMTDPGSTTGGGNINMQGGNINLSTGSIISTEVPSASSISLVPNAIFSGNLIHLNMNCTRQQNVVALPAINFDSNCGSAMEIRGDVSATVINVSQAFASVFFYQSDRRLKKDIKPIKGALDVLMKVEPVSFKFNGSDKDSMGIIAQDIEKIYPNIVTENGKDGMKSVAYHELIAPMIEAVQELKRDNDSLREQVKELKDRQTLLENNLARKNYSKP